MKRLGPIVIVIILLISLILTSCGPVSTPPSAPTGLNCNAVSSSQINLSWSASSRATGYHLYRCTGSSCTPTDLVHTGTSTSWSNTGLSPDTTYCYRVKAYNEAGESGYSETVGCTTHSIPPAAPTGFNCNAVSSSQINLSWSASSGAIGYHVYRCTGTTCMPTNLVHTESSTSWSDTGLSPSTTYRYRVTAYNGAGESGYSETVGCTTFQTPPTIEWERTYGGENHDEAYSVLQTNDQGYVMVGYTRDTDTGQADGWLIKTDANGNMAWNKTYGGNFDDEGVAIQQTGDGGYVVTGYSCFIGDPYCTYGADLWLFKTDGNGSMAWSKTYGTEYAEDYGHSVQLTSDGGYIVVGSTDYFLDLDLWLLKTDASGNYQWDRWYIRDNGRDETGFDIQQTSDGGYIIVGYTQVVGSLDVDCWLVKTDANGDMQWDKTYGGSGFDLCEDLISTSDGGYVLVGRTDSFGAGRCDFWLIKVDSSGNMEWNKTYGGTMYDGAYSVVKTSDGGYALAGTTQSFGAAHDDCWLVKTDVDGNMEWNKRYGGADPDYGHTVVQTSDGGYIVAGSTGSFGAGYLDAWLIKFLNE